MFDYMIADMESNKILTPIVIKLLLRAKEKKKNFTCLYISILFQIAYNCKTKCDTSFYNENFQKKITLTNNIKSFV